MSTSSLRTVLFPSLKLSTPCIEGKFPLNMPLPWNTMSLPIIIIYSIERKDTRSCQKSTHVVTAVIYKSKRRFILAIIDDI